jgi:hypothetical protein
LRALGELYGELVISSKFEVFCLEKAHYLGPVIQQSFLTRFVCAKRGNYLAIPPSFCLRVEIAHEALNSLPVSVSIACPLIDHGLDESLGCVSRYMREFWRLVQFVPPEGVLPSDGSLESRRQVARGADVSHGVDLIALVVLVEVGSVTGWCRGTRPNTVHQ